MSTKTVFEILGQVDYYACTNLGTGKVINGKDPHGAILKMSGVTAHAQSYESFADSVQLAWVELNERIKYGK